MPADPFGEMRFSSYPLTEMTMTNDRSDGVGMIGLYKLAAGIGDGLVPALYELLSRPMPAQGDGTNIAKFPLAPRMRRADFAVVDTTKDNILSFPALARQAVATSEGGFNCECAQAIQESS